MESEPKKTGFVAPAALLPRPRSIGSFVILLTILAFTAGRLRNELALFLLGTLLLIILTYCFFGVFFLGFVHRQKLKSLSMVITNATVPVGGEGEVSITFNPSGGKHRFWRLPMILMRCEICLETGDNRVIRHCLNPGIDKYSRFPVKERGAYHGEHDRFIIFDAPGFFRLAMKSGARDFQPGEPSDTQACPTAPAGSLSASARLLAVPRQAEEIIPISLKSGGTEERHEPHYRKSNELIDHRPYIPGDDPRRINWKLFSHTPLAELFVREGENEPPPRSRLLILIDTETDRSLYSIDEGRRAVDLLCESALAVALEFSARGMDIVIGYSGGKIATGNDEGSPMNAVQLAAALAWPAAVFRPALTKKAFGAFRTEPPEAELRRAELPQTSNDRAVLLLALPRTFVSDTSALDQFLRKREANRGADSKPRTESSPHTDIVFLYNAELNTEGIRTEGARTVSSRQAEKLEEAINVCVNHYSRRAGVHAVKAALSPGGTK